MLCGTTMHIKSVTCNKCESRIDAFICLFVGCTCVSVSVSVYLFCIMAPPPKCCNPFQKKGHNCFRKSLYFISKNYGSNFKALYGSYVCVTCKRQIYKKKDFVQVTAKNDQDQESREEKEEEKDDIEEEEEIKSNSSKNDSDYVCRAVDDKYKRLKLAAEIQEIITASPAKKRRLTLSNAVSELVLKSIVVNSNHGDIDVTDWIRDLKAALLRAENRQHKIALLTTIPVKWSIRKTARELGVSRRMVSTARKLHDDQGYGATPDKKKGRAMTEELIKTVTEFYCSDNVSRVMPGIKDVKSVKINGKRQLKTKRLLLEDIENLHKKFLSKFPDMHISLSAFKALRPKQCTPVGSKGSHNVCVCKIHGNCRLKVRGLKDEFARKNVDFQTTYHDFLEKMICAKPSPECYLGTCEKCPGTKKITQDLKRSLQTYDIKKITYNQWLTTDRCQYLTQSESAQNFVKSFAAQLPDILIHDFIAKSQASYLEQLKTDLKIGDFLVTLDFSENYTFQIQDAIQAHHWTSDQATLHVYAIYYKKNNDLHHVNYIVLSEYKEHDATAVHLYNSKMINFLKTKFGARNVKKLIYFSDGASSQYKNKSNFLNLMYHKKDFGIDAEWHFFATSHGKGPCDGNGGCVKRMAYRASLQDKTITTVQKLYEWACGFFKKIEFGFCAIDEFHKHKDKLAPRLSKAKLIEGTRQYHCFKPVSSKNLECKIFSTYEKSDVFVLG